MRSAMFTAAWLLAMLGCGALPPTHVEMSDVALVWPLPASLTRSEGDGYLTAGWVAGAGTLVPRAVFDEMQGAHPLTRVDEPDALYQNMTVVAARLDLCFREGDASARCQPNVRLVLQPLVLDGAGQVEARDAALHAFYAARDEGEVRALIFALARLREEAMLSSQSLGLHPLLQNDGGRKRVAALLAPLLGHDRLVRVTATSVHGDNLAWTFTGYDRSSGGKLEQLHIVHSDGAHEQHVLTRVGAVLKAQVSPAVTQPDDFSLLLDDDAAMAATLAQRQAAFDAAARIENPTRHNPGTTDCASCHLAAVARQAASRRETLAASGEAFALPGSVLTPTGDFSNPRLVRALGYRFKELVIAPRVVHESAQGAFAADYALHPSTK